MIGVDFSKAIDEEFGDGLGLGLFEDGSLLRDDKFGVLGFEMILLLKDGVVLLGECLVLEAYNFGVLIIDEGDSAGGGECEGGRDDGGGDEGRMSADPAFRAEEPRFAVSEDWLIGEPSFDFIGEEQRRGVALGGSVGHGFATNGVEGFGDFRANVMGEAYVSGGGFFDDIEGAGALDGGFAGQELKEGSAQAVDVGGRCEFIDAAGGLFGAHVGRGT